MFVCDSAVDSTKRQFISILDWTGACEFHDAAWSCDGSVIAVRVWLFKEREAVFGPAYDFREHRQIMPPGQRPMSAAHGTIDQKREYEAAINSLLKNRSGLAAGKLDWKIFTERAHHIFYGHIPAKSSRLINGNYPAEPNSNVAAPPAALEPRRP
jgi:hypothetical protein